MVKENVITLKVTDAERDEIDKRRKKMTRSAYIREVLFGGDLVTDLNIAKTDKDMLQHEVHTSYLLRMLVDSLGKKELVFEAKKEAEAWYEKNYVVKKIEK